MVCWFATRTSYKCAVTGPCGVWVAVEKFFDILGFKNKL